MQYSTFEPEHEDFRVFHLNDSLLKHQYETNIGNSISKTDFNMAKNYFVSLYVNSFIT